MRRCACAVFTLSTALFLQRHHRTHQTGSLKLVACVFARLSVSVPALLRFAFWYLAGPEGGARIDAGEGQSFLNLPLNETGRSLLQCMLVMEGVSGQDGGEAGEETPRLRRCLVFCLYAVLYTRSKYHHSSNVDFLQL